MKEETEAQKSRLRGVAAAGFEFRELVPYSTQLTHSVNQAVSDESIIRSYLGR